MTPEDKAKLADALRRAMPVSRMVDYGMQVEDAGAAHDAIREGGEWDQVLDDIAARDRCFARDAEDRRDTVAAREHWHRAAAALIFAQMAFTFDTERKLVLHRKMVDCFSRFAEHATPPIRKLKVPFGAGALHAWVFTSGKDHAGPAVIVFGGMSGWGTAYRTMAEALCAHGIACLLVDGPGQGESRLEDHSYLDAHVARGLSRFVDLAFELSFGPRPIGIWGNSFGGLFAALTAAADPRIGACCINGAPTRADPPPFRTAQEQMAAMFGRRDLGGLEQTFELLSFHAQTAPVRCPVLIVEGGADPLVPLGSQRAFLNGNESVGSAVFTWPDGEHTIYNHGAERNARIAKWFADRLTAPGHAAGKP